MIALSSFSLRSRHLLLSGLAGVAGLLVVYAAVELAPLAWIAGPLLLILTAGMMSWWPHRQNAIGDTVNVASRLQSLTRDRNTNILISEAVAVALPKPEESDVCLTSAGVAEVRGRTQGVSLFVPAWKHRSAVTAG